MSGDVMLGPMEPRVPCRHMETRPCVDIPADVQAAIARGEGSTYRDTECDPGKCARFPARDTREHLPFVARSMREAHGPDHPRHAMWAALADWLDRVAGPTYCASPGEAAASLAVARAYLQAERTTG